MLISDERGRHLFIRRSKANCVDSGVQGWDIPGGRIMADEPIGVALAREVAEETGLLLKGEPKLFLAQDIFTSDGRRHIVRLIYTARAKGRVILSEEHDDFKWIDASQAKDLPNLDDKLRQLLE